MFNDYIQNKVQNIKDIFIGYINPEKQNTKKLRDEYERFIDSEKSLYTVQNLKSIKLCDY